MAAAFVTINSDGMPVAVTPARLTHTTKRGFIVIPEQPSILRPGEKRIYVAVKA